MLHLHNSSQETDTIHTTLILSSFPDSWEKMRSSYWNYLHLWPSIIPAALALGLATTSSLQAFSL